MFYPVNADVLYHLYSFYSRIFICSCVGPYYYLSHLLAKTIKSVPYLLLFFTILIQIFVNY
jgi:hypothetical protein